MALFDKSWEEQFSLLRVTAMDEHDDTDPPGNYNTCLLHLSDEILVLILRQLDAISLLRVGSTCRLLFRVCSCNSLWAQHFQASFGVPYASATCNIIAKNAFRLLFMWRTLYGNLHFNRSLQEKLFARIPLPPLKYWIQWLVLEECVPLPSVRLPCAEIEHLWGISKTVLEAKVKETNKDCEIFKFEWKTLYNLAITHHGSTAMVVHHVLNQQRSNDHTELESMYHQYVQCRFQWLFTYWLFRQPPPFNRQLRAIYLQWIKHNKRKVSTWGESLCDVRYLASLHRITSDYWRGRLAQGDESVGIQTVENYFSMCKSLVAWILGRDWGRLKRRKVYEDTLEGVYLVLRREMQNKLIEHETFWQVAKIQMTRVCTLEETAANYVNWKMIEMLPYYRLYLVSGNAVYLAHVKGFLRRKWLVHNWIHLEENAWALQVLPDEFYSLLEFDTKISQDSLHGDSLVSQLSRVIWLYLNSGQVLYLEVVKGMVLQCAQAHLGCYNLS
ncbi:uncharacterized protein LOC115810293 [Chanos chanos]|uniref:Uncharacterized protein LOC115810293 n=1 Tax=Chanos chanos TaxID=29144 RepID=A0A6J2V6Y7_CHACN|nr:uncharacterized protein LOC115810293 [Chanos chanos]